MGRSSIDRQGAVRASIEVKEFATLMVSWLARTSFTANIVHGQKHGQSF
jgi:hypothetical protein